MHNCIGLIFLISFWSSASAEDLSVDRFHLIEISSHVPVVYETKRINTSQIILIQNYKIDTFAEARFGDSKKAYASWMGKNGFYYIFIPKGTQKTNIVINTLDSENQKSKIGIKLIILENIDAELVGAFKNHADATILRYQQYTGGSDKRLLALSKYQLAKSFFKQNNYKFFSALSAYEAGIIFFEHNKFNKSIDELQHSIESWRQNDFLIQKLQTLNVQGLALWKLNKLEKAIEVFDKIKQNYLQTNNLALLSNILNNLGLIYWEQGQFTKAKEHYIKALNYYGISFKENEKDNFKKINKDSINNLKQVAAIINNLALVYDSLGNTEKAIVLWNVYLDLSKSLSDKNTLAQAKNNIALLYSHKGKYNKANNLLKEAILTFEKTKNNRWLSLAQHNLGQVYLKLGLLNLAEIQFHKTLLLRNNNLNGKIESQIKLIETYRKQGRIDKSLELSYTTLNLAKKNSHHKAIAMIHLNNFFIHITNNNHKLAETEINEAINVAKGKTYKRLQSKLNVNKADLLIKIQDYNSAIKILKFEVKNLKSIWDTTLLNSANNLLAQAYIKNNDLFKAEVTITNEIGNLDFYINSSTNDKVQSDLSQMLKETLGIYNIISTLQEQSKLGFIKTNQMLAKYGAFKKNDLTKKSNLPQDSIENLLVNIKNKSLALENNKLSSEDIKQIKNDIIELKAQLDFSYLATTSNDKINIDLQEIQDALDDDTLIIQFSISEAGGVSWWISKHKFESHIIADKKTLAKLVTDARKTFLQQNNSNNSITNLSKQLLDPLVNYKSSKKIFLLLDEPLNLIPFNALIDPRFNYRYPITNTSSVQRMSSINTIYRKYDNYKKEFKALIIADPVTSIDDERLAGFNIDNNDIHSFDRLIGTKSEARNISKLTNSIVLQGFNASKSKLFATNFKNTDVLHFATHAFFHPEISGLSSLVLSSYDKQGNNQHSSFLRALEISNFDLNNELVILSGCETGVGIEDNSLGLNGLTQAFMQAGAKNLIASLWKVDDHITQRMMTEFYRGYTNGLSISNSLRQAQELIKSNPRTRHPKFWAGWFLLSN